MNYNSRQLSFWDLIQNNEIVIPIIQRDYAHGRADKKEIREDFLEALLRALTNNKKLELDFVYGDIHKGVFQPLDGQQRLTTLFLLHWYVATKENKLEQHSSQLSKFTYKTRASSREFCTELITNCGVDFNNLLPADDNKENELSKTIIDRPWFFLSWLKDPTIKAMLIMLDAIHKKFNPSGKENNLWGKLTERNIITFHHISLDGFGLSDDLYIKMNARGKALTPFENFKAKFEKHIKDKGFEKELELNEINRLKWKETFAHKIDTVWADLFWEHRNDQNLIDDAIMKFIAGLAIFGYARDRQVIEGRISSLYKSPAELKPEDFPSTQDFDYLKTSLNVYSSKEKDYDRLTPKDLPLWGFIKENSSLFIECIKWSGATYEKRALFFAQTEYLIIQNDNFNLDYFADWMRVMRNIIQNSIIDSDETLRNAIGLIKELSVGCGDIYEHLEKNNVKSNFGSVQTKEEKLKARLIKKNNAWRVPIFKAEDHPLFQGSIGFLLDEGEKEEIDLATFQYRLSNAEQVFDGGGINERFKEDAFFLRAFVSRFKSWGQLWGFNYDGTRDNWKKIFREQYLRPALLQLIDTDQANWKTFLREPSGLTDEPMVEVYLAVHEDLYKSELLASNIVHGCRLKPLWEKFFFLQPYNAKAKSKKYLIGVKRNGLLFSLYDKEQCELENPYQSLTINEKKIPFFWGMEIPIKYKNETIIWRHTQTFIIKGQEYTLQDGELDDLPKKWDEILLNGLDSPLT